MIIRVLTIGVGLALAPLANAQLTINVTGVPGSGVTTWSFGGSSTVSAGPGSFRATGATGFNFDDTFQPSDPATGDFNADSIVNTGIQDQLFAVNNSNATITIGGGTRSITQIFLDDDGTADDIGFRVDSVLSYSLDDASSWNGSGQIAVDINDFTQDFTFGRALSGGEWAADTATSIQTTFTAVPEPAEYAFSAGALLLVAAIWRKRTQIRSARSTDQM